MRLILAHAGICDLAWIWRPAAQLPNLFFDTAWWSPSDLQALLALVPPGQVLWASDAPYGTPTMSATWCMRHALQVGLNEDQVRAVMGGQVRRLLAGEDPLDLGPAVGSGAIPHDAVVERAYAFLLTSMGQMFTGVDAVENLALASLACAVDDAEPQAHLCRWIVSLIDHRAEYLPGGPERPRASPPACRWWPWPPRSPGPRTCRCRNPSSASPRRPASPRDPSRGRTSRSPSAGGR